MVEIARAVSHESDILIMDEPTSTLSEREVDQLFRIVADLKARGQRHRSTSRTRSTKCSESPTRCRSCATAGWSARSPVDSMDRDRLIAMMVGRELTQLFPKNNAPTDRVAALGEGSVAERDIFRRVVRRAGGRDSRHRRTRRLETHRGRGDDIRPQARDVRRRS